MKCFEAGSCRAGQDVELRKVLQIRVETHISDHVGRSLCIVRPGNFDSLNTVSSGAGNNDMLQQCAVAGRVDGQAQRVYL